MYQYNVSNMVSDRHQYKLQIIIQHWISWFLSAFFSISITNITCMRTRNIFLHSNNLMWQWDIFKTHFMSNFSNSDFVVPKTRIKRSQMIDNHHTDSRSLLPIRVQKRNRNRWDSFFFHTTQIFTKLSFIYAFPDLYLSRRKTTWSVCSWKYECLPNFHLIKNILLS